MVFLYSRCLLENGLSSGFLCEHKRRQWRDRGWGGGGGVSQCTADPLCICLCVHILLLRISGHLSKQTFIVHLFMHAHARLSADLISCVCARLFVCVSRALGAQSRPHCWALSAESVHYCHGRCILQPVPWLSLLAHRDAFSCSQRHFAWWAWAMASIRTDGSIWGERAEEEAQGGREKKWRKDYWKEEI